MTAFDFKNRTVFVAGGKDHLVFKSPDSLGYTAEPVDNPYRPSVHVLFGSAALLWSGLLAGVLLTGMGGDGAKGLKTLRDAGFHTIAQDESSSAVYAMPKAAAAIGAASEILPLRKIGPRLRELFGPEVKRQFPMPYALTSARAPQTNPNEFGHRTD